MALHIEPFPRDLQIDLKMLAMQEAKRTGKKVNVREYIIRILQEHVESEKTKVA